MSIFEVVLYVTLIVSLVLILFKVTYKPYHIYILIGVNSLALILHFVFDSFRWYLILLYIFIPVIIFLLGFYITKTKVLRRITIVTLTLFVISFMITLFFPVPEMPETSNGELIGTDTYVITDNTRIEQYDDSGDFRKFKIQAYYPTDNVEGLVKAKWFEEGTDVGKGLCQDNYLPLFFMNHVATVESNSYQEATIKDDSSKYPVVIISHGWSGFRHLHTDLAEELASNGYFVISIDHTYGSVATVFSDTEIAYNYKDALPVDYKDPTFLDYANTLVNTYAGDVLAVLDYLPTLNTDYNNNLNLSKIGLLGHSTGGGGDVTVALQDSRITSLFGLDAWVEPIEEELINNNLNIPAMFLRSNQWEDVDNNDNLYNLVNNNSIYSTLYQIDGTTHVDFTMAYMFSNATRLVGLTGKVKPERLNSMLDTLVVDFFDNTLKLGRLENPDITNWEEVRRIDTY